MLSIVRSFSQKRRPPSSGITHNSPFVSIVECFQHICQVSAKSVEKQRFLPNVNKNAVFVYKMQTKHQTSKKLAKMIQFTFIQVTEIINIKFYANWLYGSKVSFFIVYKKCLFTNYKQTRKMIKILHISSFEVTSILDINFYANANANANHLKVTFFSLIL